MRFGAKARRDGAQTRCKVKMTPRPRVSGASRLSRPVLPIASSAAGQCEVNSRVAVTEFEAFASLDAIEPYWRALEKEGSASPFQRFAFAASYAAHLTAASGAVPAPVLMRHQGKPAAILPLEKL